MEKPRIKQVLSASLACALLGLVALCMCSCGSSNASTGASPQASSAGKTVSPSSSSSAKSTYDASKLGWETFSYVEKTSDGYELEEAFTISGWIKSTDTEKMNAAWSYVGGKDALPTDSVMGISADGVDIVANTGTYVSYESDSTYYLFGKLDINNATDGFSLEGKEITAAITMGVGGITSNSNNGKTTYKSVDGEVLDLSSPSYDVLLNITKLRIFYSSGGKNYSARRSSGAQAYGYYGITSQPNAKLTGDRWGSVPFVIACPNKTTPNTPDGDPAFNEIRIIFGSGSEAAVYKPSIIE